jgi:hypothetical protein
MTFATAATFLSQTASQALSQTQEFSTAVSWPAYLDPNADLNAPHRLAPGERFVQLGEAGGGLLTRLMPCASYLWYWALYQKPAGTYVELDLDEFQARSQLERGKPYCLKHIRNAFQQLVDYGLIEVVKIFRSAKHVWGVRVHQAGRVANVEVSGTIFPKSEPKLPENKAQMPISSYHLTDKQSFLKTKPTHPPVLKALTGKEEGQEEEKKSKEGDLQKFTNNQEQEEQENNEIRSLEVTATAIDLNEWNPDSQVRECPREVAQTLMEKAYLDLGVRLTQPIYKLVLESTIGVVVNAIAAVKERLESQTAPPVKTKEGFFTTALRRHFTPNRKTQQPVQQQEEPKIIPPGFNEWFEAARAAKLVSGSAFIDGEMWVYRFADAVLVKWQEFRAQYPEISVDCQLRLPLPIQLPQPKSSQTQVVDLSDVICEASLEIKRLGWSEMELRQFLKQEFNKSHRSLLSEQELFEFLDQLKRL